jgi:hypothetical protein
MGTVNPRPRGPRTTASELRAARLDREQLRRQASRPPKLAPKAAPAGGGIVGMAQVLSTGGVLFQAGNNQMSYEGVTYGSPTDPNAGSGGGESSVDISSWLTVSGYQLLLSPGYYIPVLDMRVIWDDPDTAPVSFSGPYIGGGWDPAHNDNSIFPRTILSNAGKGGIQQLVNHGPTYISDGGYVHAELRGIGVPPTVDSNAALSSIVWTITKLG